MQQMQQQSFNYNQQAQQQIIQPPFGLMIPGQQAVTQFLLINNFFVFPLTNPGTIHSIGFFLLNQIDSTTAACLYYSTPPYEGMQFLGAIANTRPSDIFPTHFSLNPDVNVLPEIKLVIQIQSLDENLKSLVTLTNDDSSKYSVLIAQNLYNFMSNYNREEMINGQMQDLIVAPLNVLDKWVYKFQEKYKLDPNFIFKTTK